ARSSAGWIGGFDGAGVSAGRINSISDMLADPQVKSREMVAEVAHARAGRVKTLGTPVKFSDTPTSIRRAAPLLGEHTREVLAALGYSSAQIGKLEEEGAVVSAA